MTNNQEQILNELKNEDELLAKCYESLIEIQKVLGPEIGLDRSPDVISINCNNIIRPLITEIEYGFKDTGYEDKLNLITEELINDTL